MARVLRFGGELFSYEDYATEPPYRFTGVKRGFARTAPAAHEAGAGGGTLDISEYGATSCYIDQSTDLQDEIGAKIAEVFDAGMEFCYFDGSEGVNPPCNITVALLTCEQKWNSLCEQKWTTLARVEAAGRVPTCCILAKTRLCKQKWTRQWIFGAAMTCNFRVSRAIGTCF